MKFWIMLVVLVCLTILGCVVFVSSDPGWKQICERGGGVYNGPAKTCTFKMD